MQQDNNPAVDPELDSPAGDRTLVGSDRLDVLGGSEAEDAIFGGGGNDFIFGGSGDDQVEGGAGADKVLAGDGSDTVLGGDGNDSIDGGGDSDLVLGGDGDDTVAGGGAADTIFGGAGADTLIGAAGADVLIGGSGSDLIDGGDGDDTFIIDPTQQQPGDLDSLIGGDGDDNLEIFFADEADAQAFEDLIAAIGLEAALATLGLAVDGIEAVETVTPDDLEVPSVSSSLVANISEDGAITSFSLLGFSNDPAGGGLTAQNLDEIGSQFGAGSLDQSATELVFDPQPFQFLPGDTELQVDFGFDLVDINGASVAQTIQIRVGGVNDAPLIDQLDANADIDVRISQILPGPIGQITFEEFSVGDTEPLTDGFLTISSEDGNQQVQAAQFTSIPGVFEGQFFSLARSDIFLDFQSGVSIVNFGLFDPNVAGGFVRALDGDGQVIEELETGVDIPIGPPGGTTSQTVTFISPNADIRRIEVDLVPGDLTAVDQIFYGALPVLNATASFTFDPIDDNDQHTVELLDVRFDGDVSDLPSGLNAEDFITDVRLIEASGLGALGRVEVDFAADNTLFQALDGTDEVALIADMSVTDEDGASDQASVTFNLTGANDAPVAVSDFAVTDEDAPILIDVLLNDIDPDGDDLSVILVNGVDIVSGSVVLPSGATVSLNNSGQIAFDPTTSADLQALNAGDVVGDVFTYTISDQDGLSSTGTVLVSVEGRNEPVTLPLTQFATIPTQSGSLYGGAVSPDGQEIFVIQQFSTTVDVYDVTGNLLRQFPLPGDNGNDGDLFFANGPSVLNGTDLPAGTLFALSGDSGPSEIFAIDATTGAVLETLNTDFGQSFVVGADFNPSTGTLYLLSCNCDNPGNEIAEVDPTTGEVLRRFNLDELGFQTFFGDLAVDPTTGDLLVVTDQQPEILRLSSDFDLLERLTLPNTVTGLSGIGIPDAGTGSFYVMSTNGNVFELGSDPQISVNLAPIVSEFSETFDEDDGTVLLSVLDNADDPEDDPLFIDTLSQEIGRDVGAFIDGNEISIDLDSFNSLSEGQTGTLLFTFDVSDGINTVENTARITITGDNDPVTGVGDRVTTDEETTLAISIADLLANDQDPDLGDTLRIAGLASTSAAGAQIGANETTIFYDPSGIFDGLDVGQSQTDTFTYEVTDGEGSTDTVTVTVLVNGVNSAPRVSTLQVRTNEDAGVEVFDLLAAPIEDPEGIALIVSNLNQLGGTNLLSANAAQIVGRNLEFDTGEFNGLSINEEGFAEFSYDISEGINTVENSIEITVEGRNDAPVFGDLSFSNPTLESTISADLFLAAVVDDPDQNDLISAQNIVQSAGRDVNFSVNGAILGFDIAGFFEDLSAGVLEDIAFDYEISDGTVVLPRSFSLQIEGENDPVTANDDGGDVPVGARLFGGVGHGRVVEAAGDVNGDGIDDFMVSAPATQANGVFRSGQTYVVFGDAAGLPVEIDVTQLDGSNGFLLSGIDAFDDTGLALALAGDFNGDGIDDLIFGAANADQNDQGIQDDEGEAYVVFGTDQGFDRELVFSDLDGDNGFLITGITALDMTGAAVSSAGDINGDGAMDIAITSPGDDVNGTYSGQTTVLFGGADFGAVFDLADVDDTNGILLNGPQFSVSGISVTPIADINGDGLSDLAIGARGLSVSPPGQVFVVFGYDFYSFPPSIELENLNGGDGFVLNGVSDFDALAESLDDAGDFNGDGINDLIIGNPAGEPDGLDTADDRGEVFILFGRDTGFSPSFTVDDLTGDDGLRITGINPGDGLGDDVAGVGDVNGDGIDDILIGASQAGPSNNATGQSYLVFGSDQFFANGIDLASLDGTNGYILNGTTVGGLSGRSVAGIGDVNGDGVTDLAIGAPTNGSTGESFVLFGGNALAALDEDGDGVISLPDVVTESQLSFTTAESAFLEIDPVLLLANDVDIDSDDVLRLSAVSDRSAAGAIVDILGNGRILYNPAGVFDQLNDGQTQIDTFTYTVTDDQGSTDTATVSITITGVSGNSAPNVSTLQVRTNEDAGVEVFDLLAAPISDPDGDVLSVANLNQLGGTVLLSSNAAQIVGQNLEFDTSAFNELSIGDSDLSEFSYEVSDGQIAVENRIEVTVEGRNDAPVFTDLGFVNFISEDQDRSNRALDLNVVDPDTNDVISIQNLVQTGGRLVNFELQGNRLVFDIAGSFDNLAQFETEVIEFTYQIFDGTAALPRVIETGIIGENDAPLGVNDSDTVSEDATILIDVLANDIDPDNGDILQITSLDVLSPLGALLDIEAGQIRYDTNGAFDFLPFGEGTVDSFTYQFTDSEGVSSQALVEITITGENDDVVPLDDSVTTDEASAIVILGANLLGNDDDPDLLDVLEIVDFSADSLLGDLSFDGTDFTYDPNGAFDSLLPGDSETDSFSYTVSDGNGSEAEATVTITVTGADTAPTGVADFLIIDQDGTVQFEVLNNDIDPDGILVDAELTDSPDGFADRVVEFNFTGTRAPLDPAEALGPSDRSFVSLPTGTTITLSFEEVIIDGVGDDFRVIEESNSEGAIVEASADGVNFVNFGQINGTVGFDLANSVTLDFVTHVRLTGLDNGGSSPGFDLDAIEAINTAGLQGLAAIDASNVLDYDPNDAFDSLGVGETALERLTYVLTDDGGNSASSLVQITVQGLNDPVTAVDDDGFTTDEASSLEIDADALTSNDIDIDTSDILTITSVSASASGARVDLIGGTVFYDPNGAFDNLAAGESTTDTFTYTVSDGNGSTDQASVEVTITGLSQAVTGGNDLASTDEDTVLNLAIADLLANDVGDGLDITAVSALSTSGAPITVAGGTITYDPRGLFDFLNDGDIANDFFTYTVTDVAGNTDDVTVSIRIDGANDDPIQTVGTQAEVDLVSINFAGTTSGSQGGGIFTPQISADGTAVAFLSFASDLVPGDTNVVTDLFLRDLSNGVTQRVNLHDGTGVASSQPDPNGFSISGDGNLVVFSANDENLDPTFSVSGFQVYLRNISAGTTELVSIGVNGTPPNSISFQPSISDDGRFVAFRSSATNLINGLNGAIDEIYVRDLQNGTNAIASLDADGNLAAGFVASPVISGDGTSVVFGTNKALVSDDQSGSFDFYIRDLDSGVLERVSVNSAGESLFGSVSGTAAVSEDGRFVVFETSASNIDANDQNGVRDVYIRDRLAGTTELVSVDLTGLAAAEDGAFNPDVSADGRFVTFSSTSRDLVLGDDVLPASAFGVFIHDRVTGETRTVNQTATGTRPGDASGLGAAVSADGQTVAFTSQGDGNSLLDPLSESGSNFFVTQFADGEALPDLFQPVSSGNSFFDLLAGFEDPEGSTLTGELISITSTNANRSFDVGIVDADGILDVENNSFQNIAAGETETITIRFGVLDEDGGSITAEKSFDLIGLNDPPSVFPFVTNAEATEDTGQFSLDLSGVADDEDGDPITFENLALVTGQRTLFVENFDDDALNNSVLDGGFLPVTAGSGLLDQFEVVSGQVDIRNNTFGSQGGALDLDGSNTTGTDNPASRIQTIEEFTFQAGFEYELLFTLESNALSTQRDTVFVSIPSFVGQTIDIDPGDPRETFSFRFSTAVTLTSPLIFEMRGDSDLEGAILDNITLTEAPSANLIGSDFVVNTNIFDDLAEGEVRTFIYTFDASDGVLADQGQISLELTGVNDDVVAVGETFDIAENDEVVVTVEDLLENEIDPDLGDVLSISEVDTTSDLGVAILVTDLATGEVVYDPGTLFDNLDSGQVVNDFFTYTVTDNQGSVDTATVEITITGENDLPSITAGDFLVQEDTGSQQFDLSTLINDPDGSAVLSFDDLQLISGGVVIFAEDFLDDATAAGVSAGSGVENFTDFDQFTVSSGSVDLQRPISDVVVDLDGSSTPGSNDPAGRIETIDEIQLLAATSYTLSFDLEGNPASSSDDQVQVQFGSLLDETITVTPGAAEQRFNFTFTTDTPESIDLSFTGLGPNDGAGALLSDIELLQLLEIDLDSDGQLTVDADSLDPLANNAVEEIAFTYSVNDGVEDLTGDFTVRATGVNDEPVTGLDTFTTDEETLFSITAAELLANDSDPDFGDQLSIDDDLGVSNLGVTLTGSGGVFSYDPSGLFDELSLGESVTDEVQYVLRDQFGASATGFIEINVTGLNDIVTFSGGDTTGAVTEDSGPETLTATGVLDFIDIDLNDTHTIQAVSDTLGAIGGFAVNLTDQATGDGSGELTWAYALENAAIDQLAGGETLSQDYTITVLDGNGSSNSVSVTITITGANDAPVIELSPVTATLSESDAPFTFDLTTIVSDVDNVADLSFSGLSASTTIFSEDFEDEATATFGSTAGTIQAQNFSDFDQFQVTAGSVDLQRDFQLAGVGSEIDLDGTGVSGTNNPAGQIETINEISFRAGFEYEISFNTRGLDTLNVQIGSLFNEDIAVDHGFAAQELVTRTFRPVVDTTADLVITNLGFNDNVGVFLSDILITEQALADLDATGAFSFDPALLADGLGSGDTALLNFSYDVTDGIDTETGAIQITVNGAADPLIATTDNPGENRQGGLTLNGVSSGDRVGQQVTALGDINGDLIDDIAVSAPLTTGGSLPLAGATYVIFGDADIDQTASLDLTDLNGSNGFRIDGFIAEIQSGRSITNAGDLNGDGFDDILIGALESATYGYATRAYVLFGDDGIGSTGVVELDEFSLDGTNGFVIVADNAVNAFDSVVRDLGDINGDGFADIGIHHPSSEFDTGSRNTGQMRVIFGSSDLGDGGLLNLSDLNGTNGFFVQAPEGPYTDFSYAAAAGNIDGDTGGVGDAGFDEVLLGDTALNSFLGGVVVIRGDSALGANGLGAAAEFELGGYDYSNLDGSNGFVLFGPANQNLFGNDVDTGDVNGDGIDDVLVAADSAFNDGLVTEGRVYLLLGSDGLAPTTGNTIDFDDPALAAQTATFSSASNTYLGEVETVGDVNGDGIEDILIGSGGVVPFSGISYLVFGSGSLGGSTVDLDALDGSNGYRFADTTAIDAGGPVNGEVLSGAGDLNGDGLADLLLGAPRFDSPSGSTNFGQGTVIFGGTGQLSQLDALDSSSDGLIDLANIGNSVFGDLVTDEDTVLSFAAADLTRNDIDPEGETITVTAVDSVSTQGIAIDFSNGQITYDPGAAFQSLSDGQTQEDSFTYTITAGSRTAQGTVNLSILGVNDDPIGIVSLGLQQNRTDRADTLGPENGDFTDPDGDVLTFTAQLAGGQPLPTFLDNAFQGEDGDFTLDVGDGIGSEGLYHIETDVSDGNGGLLELDYYLVTNGVDIFGTAVGEELVTASSGGVSELFRSGQGRDRMQGGDGTDIYVYTSGDDFDAILDNGFGDNDALLFEDLDRITASFSRFIPEEDDLLVRFDDQDQIRVVGGLSASLNQNIETYNFADGTSLTPAEIRALIVEQQGTGGDDTIFGFSAGEVDVLIGGLGNDVKTGGDGSDDYRYTLGDGEDVIDDNGFFDTDRLFIEGVSQGQLSFSRRGFDINDLLIGMRDGGSIHVVGALNGSSNDEIEEYVIVDDAATLTAQDLREIIIARATSEGADSIRGFSEADDTITGGSGDDLLIGSGGSDLYVYDFSGDGDGSDTIFDDGFASTDILRLDNLLASRAEFRQEFGSNTLEIDLTLAGGPVIETIRVVNQLEGSSSDQIEQVVFSQEGITLTAADLRDEVIAQQLLDGSATLSGFTTSADTLTADSNTLFMTGGSEGDTYQVDASNSGLVVIEDNGNNTEDRLEFSNVFGALSATRAIDDLNDLVLTADIFAVRIVNGLDNTNADTIEIVQEGTVGDTTIADLRARVIAGENTSGNDVIFGTSSDDSITLDTGEDFVDLSSGGGDTLTHRAGTGGKLIFTNTDSAADRLILSGTSSTDIELITLAFAQDVVSIDNTVQDESTILLNGLDALAFETVELDDLTLTGTEFVDAVAANANGFDSETGDDTANTLFAGASALDHVALSGLGADDTYDVITDASFGTPSAGLVEIFDNAFSNNDLLVLSGFSVDAYTIEIVASNKDGSNSLDALDEGDLRIGTPNDTDIIIHNAFSANGRIENFRFTSAFGSEDLTLAEVRDIAIANQFTANDDTVVGTELAELIQAADGGQDVLRGLAGNDTYAIDEIFDQSVVIDDSSSSGGDVLEISGLDFADAVFSRVPGDEDDLVISDPTVFNRTILIKNTLNSNFVGAIETIRFDDQDIDLATVRSTIFQQELSDLGDTVIGSTVADTLFSSLGDDVLNGRNGADIYQIDTRNIGTVIIDDGAGGGDDQVILNFASAATTEFSQDPLSTDDLILDFGGRRTVTIQNTLSDNFVGGIATLTFDDGTGLIQSLSMLDVRNIILDNAATTGNDRISAFTVADTIDAGEGNDLLEGRDGSDTYVFNPGDGQDIIDDNGSFDTDVLDLGFETSDLVLGRGGAAGNDILLQFQSSTDQVTVINGYSGGQQDGIEQFQFTDATLTTADLRQRFLDAQVTSGDDVIVGFNGAETLSGGEGNDTLIGSTGNDIYLIEIGDGDDLIEDQVTSNSNADEIRFVGRNFADVSFSLLQPGLDEVLIEAGSDQVIVVDAIGSNGAIEFYVFDDLLLTRDEMETLL